MDMYPAEYKHFRRVESTSFVVLEDDDGGDEEDGSAEAKRVPREDKEGGGGGHCIHESKTYVVSFVELSSG